MYKQIDRIIVKKIDRLRLANCQQFTVVQKEIKSRNLDCKFFSWAKSDPLYLSFHGKAIFSFSIFVVSIFPSLVIWVGKVLI